jgi:hypothetical protein
MPPVTLTEREYAIKPATNETVASVERTGPKTDSYPDYWRDGW